MATAQPTVDHDEIREWVEARGGHPAAVRATGSGDDPGILRIDFPGFSGEETLEEIGWDEFFDWFDRNDLALLLSDEEGNRFNKLVSRGSGARKKSSKKTPAKKASSSRGVKKASQPSSSRGSAKASSTKTTKKASSATRKAAATTKKAGGSTTKKASGSTRKAGGTTKKAGGSTKKAGGSTKKAGGSTKKASASAKKASTSAKRTGAARRSAAPSRATKKAAATKAPAKKTATTRSTPARKQSAGTRGTAKTSKRATTTSKKSGSGSVTTTDHDEIRRWVEARGGFPAHVRRTGSRRGDLGVLRIDYPGYSGQDTLERIDWEDWFRAFDRNKLAFLYQDKRNSRFSKLVAR